MTPSDDAEREDEALARSIGTAMPFGLLAGVAVGTLPDHRRSAGRSQDPPTDRPDVSG